MFFNKPKDTTANDTNQATTKLEDLFTMRYLLKIPGQSPELIEAESNEAWLTTMREGSLFGHMETDEEYLKGYAFRVSECLNDPRYKEVNGLADLVGLLVADGFLHVVP
ncbi:hypothetical protein [Roseofilum capinflatum]|uniref:Uncharacterized protein n=1 Tax=Roseofilum capinflatum BLCC-M114 TaxID=3022440 RepID=A0ABT7B6V1_9CYAN|nr:hypothetical protein [Roseofilum capinflatum]MDJ1174880.1 hypothetical protein [Roseofilum capinflatum BLCC-M114]